MEYVLLRIILSLFLFHLPVKGLIDMKENQFQANLIREIKTRFPGCIVMKNDSSYIQGIPDLLILYKDRWASLEVKKDERASHRPNQDYYIRKMDDMSYAKFIYPQNREEILYGLEQTLLKE